jgi:hypothetical protein
VKLREWIKGHQPNGVYVGAVLVSICVTAYKFGYLRGWAYYEALLSALGFGLLVAYTLQRVGRFLFEPLFRPVPLTPPIPENAPWRKVVAYAENDCDALAGYHDSKSRYFLVAGLCVALVGVGYFVWVLVQVDRQDTTQQEDFAVNIQKGQEKALQVIAAQTEALRAVVDMAYNARQEKAELLNWQEAGKYPAAHVIEFSRRYDDVAKALVKLSDTLADQMNVVQKNSNEFTAAERERAAAFAKAKEAATLIAARRSELKFQVFQLFRTASGFIFIEIIAGFLLSLSRGNDVQASYWRAHREVYDRLLSAPGLFEELKKQGLAVDKEFLADLLEPKPVKVVGGKLDNPATEVLRLLSAATGESFGRLRKRAKEQALGKEG